MSILINLRFLAEFYQSLVVNQIFSACSSVDDVRRIATIKRILKIPTYFNVTTQSFIKLVDFWQVIRNTQQLILLIIELNYGKLFISIMTIK